MASGNNVAQRVIKLVQQQPEQQQRQQQRQRINEQPTKCARLHLLIYAPSIFLIFLTIPRRRQNIPHRRTPSTGILIFASLPINQSGILPSSGISLTPGIFPLFLLYFVINARNKITIKIFSLDQQWKHAWQRTKVLATGSFVVVLYSRYSWDRMGYANIFEKEII